MPDGESKGRVHTQFRNRLRALQASCELAGQAARGQGQRAWQVPSSEPAAQDIFDLEHLHRGDLDRSEINTNYLDCLKDAEHPGTEGDTTALKQQIDYLAAEERAIRMRYMSTARCLTHAASRRYFLGVGGVYPNIEKQVADILAAGGATT